MPIDYKKYPSNWKIEIVPQVKERDNNRCAFCGISNYTVFRYGSLGCKMQYNPYDKCNTYQEALSLKENAEKESGLDWKIIVLTVAHLNHDINDNDLSNLKALCQKCHLNYDKEHHKKNSRETLKKKKGIVELPFSVHHS